MKRLLALLLVLSMVVSLLPATVLAEAPAGEEAALTEQMEEPQEDPEKEPEPSEAEPTEPSEAEPTDPSEAEPTEPSEAEPTEPSEAEPTEPSEEEPTEPQAETVFEETALDAGEFSGTCGDSLTWTFDPETATLTVAGQGSMSSYATDTPPWANLAVRTLVIEEGVTTVGPYAFDGKTTLTGTLKLPESVYSLGTHAFSGTSLTELKLSGGLENINTGAFLGASQLTVTGSLESVTWIGSSAFEGCTALTGEITFGSNLDTLQMNCFKGTGITKVTLPATESGLSYANNAFAGCENLTAILADESSTQFASVNGILLSKDKTNVLSVPGGLKEKVTVPEGVTTIQGYAFQGTQITTLELPKSLQSIEECGTRYCTIENVSYAGSRIDKQKLSIGYYNEGIQAANWTCAGSDADSYTYDAETRTLTILQDTGDWRETFENGHQTTAPWGSLNAKTLVIGDGVSTIGAYAFCGMPIREVQLPDSLRSIGFGAFSSCASLKSIRLNQGLKGINHDAFLDTAITEFTLPDSLEFFYGSSFGYANRFYLSDTNPNFLMEDGAIYSKAEGDLQLVACPAGKTGSLKVKEGTGTIVRYAFDRSSLTEVTLPMSLEVVEQGAFTSAQIDRIIYAGTWADMETRVLWQDNSLPNVRWSCATSGSCGENLTWTYSENTKTLTVSGRGAMENYSKQYDMFPKAVTPWFGWEIEKLVLGEGLTHIGNMAFYGHDELTGQVQLPASLETIGAQAFVGCKELTAYAVAEGNRNFRAADGVLYSFDGALCAIPGGMTGRLQVLSGTTVIQAYAGASGQITELTLPASVVCLEENAFAGSKVTKVYYEGSEEDRSGIECNGNLGSARWFCASSGQTGENLTWTYDALTRTLTVEGTGAIPAYDYLSTDGCAPWSGCKVEHLVIGKEITAIGAGAFARMGDNLSGTLDLSDTAVTAIGSDAFAASALTRIILPAGLTDCRIAHSFSMSTKLTEMEVPAENETFASLDGVVYSKDGKTLFYCPTGRTESLTVPEGTQTIGAYAFMESGIGEIVLPESLQKVEEDAFSDARLSKVDYLGTAEQWAAITVEDGNQPLTDATLRTAENRSIGEGLEWSYDAGTGTLTVSGTGEMDHYAPSFPAPWHGETVRRLVVAEGVTGLGSYAFADLSIKTVTLPESLVSVGENAFAGTPKGIQVTYAGSNERWTYAVAKDDCGLNGPKMTCKGKNVTGDLTWSFNAKNGTMTVSGKGEMADYNYMDGQQQGLPDWRRWELPVQKLTFSADVTYIGIYAFMGMPNLRQVTLPKKLEEIGMNAFAHTGLTGKLTIPAGVKRIEDFAFYSTAVTAVDLPAGTALGWKVFYGCTQLTDITYGGSEAALRSMLGDDIARKLNLHCKNSGGVVGEYIFWTLDKQGTLTLSAYYDSGCIPDFDSYEDTPWAGEPIKKLVLTDGITGIGANAFSGCTGLTGEVTLPQFCIYLGENAFANTGIKTLRINVDLGREWIDALKGYGEKAGFAESAFEGGKLTDVYYAGSESCLRELLGDTHPLLSKKLHCAYPYGGYEGRMEDGVCLKWTIDSKGLLTVTTGLLTDEVGAIPDYTPLGAPWSGYHVTALKLEGVTAIGANAFYGLNNLTKLSIPDTVKTVGKQAFYGCIGVTGTLTVPEGVAAIGDRAFGNLPKITALTLPASLSSLGDGAFEGCTGLKTVTFAGSMAKLLELDRYRDLWNLDAAMACQDSSAGTFRCGAAWTLDGKGTMTITGEGTLALTDDERGMLGILGVRKVVIEPGITEIGAECFHSADITEVSLPEGLNRLRDNAFRDCRKLTKVTLPASLEALEAWSLDNNFLKTITVAKGSKSLAVKGGVLYSLDMKKLLLVPTGIKKLTIPDSVTTIAAGALGNGTLTALVLGAGIGPESAEGNMGFAGLTAYNNITSLTVSKKNTQLRASGNVLFAGSTLVFYPFLKPGTEYQVPEGTTAIAQNAFNEYYGGVYQYLRKLILPASLEKLEGNSIQSFSLELVVLGEETAIEGSIYCRELWCPDGSQAADDAAKYRLSYTLLPKETITLFFRIDEPDVTGAPDAITGTAGDKVTLPKKAPGLKGYTFLGWQEQNGKTVYQPGTTLTLTGDMTLVPLFRKNGLVQEGTCGSDTKWTLDKKGILTVSGTGRAEMITPETGNRITAKGLVIEEGVYVLSSDLLRNVTVKGKVTIPASMQRIFEGVFADQTGITGVSFASDMDGLGLEISEDAFRGCTGLKGTVTLPYQLISLDATAFDGCTGITALNTATTSTYGGFSGVDGVLYSAVRGWRLVRCPEGKTGAITIPTDTTYIQSEAFRNTKVTKIYYEGGEETWRYIDGREYLPVYPTFAYEIRYHSNVFSPSKAQLTMSNPNPNSILASQSVTLKNPTMQGYIFRGWYNDAEEKVTKIAKGTNAAVRLTARFDPITYTVAYNANGGKGSMAKVTATYDQDLTVAENGFTRPGYTFAGWNTAKNGTGTQYMPWDTPSNLTTKQKGTVTLYAQWKKNK